MIYIVGQQIRVTNHPCGVGTDCYNDLGCTDKRYKKGYATDKICTINEIRLPEASESGNIEIRVDEVEHCYLELDEIEPVDLTCTCGIGVCDNCRSYRRN